MAPPHLASHALVPFQVPTRDSILRVCVSRLLVAVILSQMVIVFDGLNRFAYRIAVFVGGPLFELCLGIGLQIRSSLEPHRAQDPSS